MPEEPAVYHVEPRNEIMVITIHIAGSPIRPFTLSCSPVYF